MDTTDARDAQPASAAPACEKAGLLPLTVAAIGIVFGDIGTSPLYTMREAFSGSHTVAGVFSRMSG